MEHMGRGGHWSGKRDGKQDGAWEEPPGGRGNLPGGHGGAAPRAPGEGLGRAAACGASDQAGDKPRRLDFSDLDLPECLLIKPIRLWLHGPENWTLVGMQYTAHFGPTETNGAMMALRGLIEVLNAGGRRTMKFHKAWSRLTTGDERALVALAAAVQSGDRQRAEAMALRLVRGPWQASLVEEMEMLMAAFSAKGHRFVHLPPRGAGRHAGTGLVKACGETRRWRAPASRP